jgi:hypothetical protein
MLRNSKFFLSNSLKQTIQTAADYIALPKKDRETKYGLYLVPFALAFDFAAVSKNKSEWDKFYDFIRKEYPIQWFFRRWLLSLDNPVYKAYNLLKHHYLNHNYAIKRFFKPLFPRWRKSCPRHCYTDIIELIPKSNFALILDFWHEEISKEWINWNSDDEHKTFYKQLKNAVKYIEEGRQKLQNKADIELEKVTKNKKKGLSYQERYGKFNAVEKLIEDQDTHILSWFIKNRGYFWT